MFRRAPTYVYETALRLRHERYAFNSQTGRVYVTAFATPDLDTNTALVVVDGQRYLNNNPSTPNPAFNILVTTVTTYDAVSIDLAVDETSNRVVVPSFTGYKTYIIDGATNSIITTIPFGQTPSDVALDAAAGYAYVPVQQNYVQKINVRMGAADVAIPLAGLTSEGDVNPLNGLFYVGRTQVSTDLLSVNGAGQGRPSPARPRTGTARSPRRLTTPPPTASMSSTTAATRTGLRLSPATSPSLTAARTPSRSRCRAAAPSALRPSPLWWSSTPRRAS